jgi:hypothetical protein
MLRTLFAAGVMLAAAPALAQDNSSDQQPAVGVTAPPADSDIRVEGNPEQQRLVDKSVPTVIAPTADIELAVDTEWDNFDKDKNAQLDEMEFAWFMKKIRETAGNVAKTSEEVGRLNAATFVEADTDDSKTISRDEMVELLKTEG